MFLLHLDKVCSKQITQFDNNWSHVSLRTNQDKATIYIVFVFEHEQAFSMGQYFYSKYFYVLFIILIDKLLHNWYVFFTRYRCAESNKGNGIDGVFQEDEATKMASNVANDSSTKTDHGNRNHEAGISAGNIFIQGWNVVTLYNFWYYSKYLLILVVIWLSFDWGTYFRYEIPKVTESTS